MPYRKRSTKRIRTTTPTEEADQIAFVQWMSVNNIPHYAIPNGGYRSMTEGVKLKRCGVQSGIPDLAIPLPTKSHHGLYIELKRISGGKVSENQKKWLAYLNSVGYHAAVACGFDEAKAITTSYLRNL